MHKNVNYWCGITCNTLLCVEGLHTCGTSTRYGLFHTVGIAVAAVLCWSPLWLEYTPGMKHGHPH